ncbi:hypothetical protein ACLOJK_035999 [Asimina triloba]
MFGPLDFEKIMSRYKPIAPKPQLLYETSPNDQDNPTSPPISPPRIRPGRPRKKCKTANASPPVKRPDNHFMNFSPYSSCLYKRTTHLVPRRVPESARIQLVALQPPACACSALSLFPNVEEDVGLNRRAEIPQEKDLLQKLQTPLSGPKDSGCGAVIAPQPVRPVGSTIIVESLISEGSGWSAGLSPPASKKPKEVEEEIELEASPSIVSDSCNRVRLANTAYMELVGQPECPWLGSMVSEEVGSKRICGEVALVLQGSMEVPISSRGFSCRAKIEWFSNGHKIFIHAPCDVVKLSCGSKDYLFTWKFHTNI